MDLQARKDQIKKDVESNKVVLFMKGNKMAPQCGFSGQVVHILNQSGVDYATQDVLLDEVLREAIKDYSDWPTLPQLYVDGEFVGGCDIIMELHESRELSAILGVTATN
ncbi:Grx4 family monothiol glutaredoxin [bacterium]|jgi:monothiol glutaredoxin|nr:Grx4 family monothiol glutaredoxin [bacterium]